MIQKKKFCNETVVCTLIVPAANGWLAGSFAPMCMPTQSSEPIFLFLSRNFVAVTAETLFEYLSFVTFPLICCVVVIIVIVANNGHQFI